MTQSLAWHPELIQRYDQACPRYTSYPTAMEFRPVENDCIVRQALSDSDSQDLSLYLHIPFCRNICYYCGCNKIITKRYDRAEAYVDALITELHLKADLCGRRRVRQIHFGGGTPTFLTDDDLSRIMAAIHSRFDIIPEDIGIEIDPRTLGSATLGSLKQLGFNRLSLGIQDLNPDVQDAVNRQQPERDIDAVMQEARALGFNSINIDLIYGLPRQTQMSFQRTIARVIQWQPERISLFHYAHLPERFKPQRRINIDELPDSATKLTLFGDALAALAAAGYQHIGLDHFAKPDDSLAQALEHGQLKRNFQGYTTHADCHLMGLGVSAISQSDQQMSQNHTDLTMWHTAIQEGRLPVAKAVVPGHDDRLRHALIMALLCQGQCDWSELSERFGVDARHYFAPEMPQLERMADDDLLHLDGQGLTITPRGRFLVRQIATVFDRYRRLSEIPLFSRAV